MMHCNFFNWETPGETYHREQNAAYVQGSLVFLRRLWLLENWSQFSYDSKKTLRENTEFTTQPSH